MCVVERNGRGETGDQALTRIWADAQDKTHVCWAFSSFFADPRALRRHGKSH